MGTISLLITILLASTRILAGEIDQQVFGAVAGDSCFLELFLILRSVSLVVDQPILLTCTLFGFLSGDRNGGHKGKHDGICGDGERHHLVQATT